MQASDLTFRPATREDLPAIVALLANDPLGARRENHVLPLPASYEAAFAAIDQDPNNELVVVDTADQAVAGVLQLTLVPHVTYQGGAGAHRSKVSASRPTCVPAGSASNCSCGRSIGPGARAATSSN